MTIYLVRSGSLYLRANETPCTHFDAIENADVFSDKGEAIEAAEQAYRIFPAKQIEVVPFIAGSRIEKIGFES